MDQRRAVSATTLVLATVCWSGVACAGDSGDGPPEGGELVVSAASSLTDSFAELAERFEQQHPEVDVVLNLDSSATLSTQVVRGAPVDVFASADGLNMDEVVEAGLVVGTPVELATNTLVMVAGADEAAAPADLADLEDVTEGGGVLALCARSAPCGRLADEVLDSSGLTLAEGQVTRAPNARGTLGAVTRGDATAALVYATDAQAAGDAVSVVTLPSADAASTAYFVAALDGGGGDPAIASAFVEFVTSPEGAEVLMGEGFG